MDYKKREGDRDKRSPSFVLLRSLPATTPTHPPQTANGGRAMKSLSVINKRFVHGGIYVGRPSPLGNPFKIGRDGDRQEVIAKYRRWLWGEIQAKDTAVLRELERIRAIAQAQPIQLACWCAPEPCHAEVIKACIEWMEKG